MRLKLKFLSAGDRFKGIKNVLTQEKCKQTYPFHSRLLNYDELNAFSKENNVYFHSKVNKLRVFQLVQNKSI